MVGVLTDKNGLPAITRTPAAEAQAVGDDHVEAVPRPARRTVPRRFSIELSDVQLQLLLAQWGNGHAESPDEIVLYHGGQRVGALKISEARFLT
jgi:hypothetical protein